MISSSSKSSLNNNNNNNNSESLDQFTAKLSNEKNMSHLAPPLAPSSFYYQPPKICPRHRVPSVCSSEAGTISYKSGATGASGGTAGHMLSSSIDAHGIYMKRRTRSFQRSECASSVDLNEFKVSRSSFSFANKRKRSSHSISINKPSSTNKTSSSLLMDSQAAKANLTDDSKQLLASSNINNNNNNNGSLSTSVASSNPIKITR
jgi:hypothetical protein